MRRALGVLVGVALCSCVSEDSDPGGADESTASSGTDDSGNPTTASSTSDPDDSTTESNGTTGPGTEDSSGGGSESNSGTDTDDPPGGPDELPTPSGPCPTFADGNVTFAPAGIPNRSVRLWMTDAAQTLDGPLVFYWHGTGSSPEETSFGLGDTEIAEITALGGIVAAPFADPGAGQFPWYLVTGTQEDDLLLADEVVACALEQPGIDTTHIHSMGMSAGGLQTSQMSFRRSSYLASVVTYSGGVIGPVPTQDPANKFAAMIFHGGPGDIVVISFQEASENYLTELTGAGHFAFICNHGNGHTIPQAQSSVWQFFQDHPWGTTPSTYAGGLPAGFPAYCSL